MEASRASVRTQTGKWLQAPKTPPGPKLKVLKVLPTVQMLLKRELRLEYSI